MIIGTAGSAHDLCLHSMWSHSSQPCDSSKHFSLPVLTCIHLVYCSENGRSLKVWALNQCGQFSLPPTAILKITPEHLAEHTTCVCSSQYQRSLCIWHQDIPEYKLVQILEYYPHVFSFVIISVLYHMLFCHAKNLKVVKEVMEESAALWLEQLTLLKSTAQQQ